jgi:hypothetical protein
MMVLQGTRKHSGRICEFIRYELVCLYVSVEDGKLLLNYYRDTRCELVINGHLWWNLGMNDEQTMKLLFDEYYLALNS